MKEVTIWMKVYLFAPSILPRIPLGQKRVMVSLGESE